MTAHNKDRRTMFSTVDAVFIRFWEVIATIPALVISIGLFRDALADITKYTDEAKKAKPGKYEKKVNTKHALIVLLVPAAASMRSFARKNKLEAIIKLTNGITRAYLLKLSKNDFDNFVDSFYKELDANRLNLSDYNIKPENVDAIKTTIDDFRKAEDSHLMSGSEKSSAIIGEEEAFDKADDILKEDIDGLIEHFREDNNDFYNIYIAARVIKDVSGGNTKTAAAPEQPAAPQNPQ